MWDQRPSFRFEIDNFSKKEAGIASQTFVSGGCEWYLNFYPNGYRLADNNHLSLYLRVANSTLLPTGWKRSAKFYFVVLNQSDKELYRSPIEQTSTLFSAESLSWGFGKTLPLSTVKEKGVLENDKLFIEFYINVLEAVDGEAEVVSEKKETVDINGFQVLTSEVTLVSKIFAEHPEIAEDLKPKNQMVKTTYMNILLNLIETLHKPSQNLSETELSKAHIELCELMEQGFKLDWLKSKLEEVSLVSKKTNDVDGSRVQQLEERVKSLEVMELGSLKSKLEVVYSVMKKAEDDDESRALQLEERFKNLELMMKKLKDADGSRVQQFEERFKSILELMESGLKMDCLISKLEGVFLEKKKAEADESQFQQHEERIKNLELMLSNLKVELEKKKTKSCADGFLLVNEVA